MSHDPLEDLEAEIDARSAAVLWNDDDEPEVVVTGCSRFEAVGLMLHGLFELLFDGIDFEPDDE